MSVRLKIVENSCRQRGIGFRVCPAIFEKHRLNLSFFYNPEGLIYWTFEIRIRIEGGFLTKHTRPKKESSKIKEILEEVVFAEPEVLQYYGKVVDSFGAFSITCGGAPAGLDSVFNQLPLTQIDDFPSISLH